LKLPKTLFSLLYVGDCRHTYCRTCGVISQIQVRFGSRKVRIDQNDFVIGCFSFASARPQSTEMECFI